MSKSDTTVLDLSGALAKFEDQWVALHKESKAVVLAEKSLDKLLTALSGTDLDTIEFLKVPKSDICYVPLSNEI